MNEFGHFSLCLAWLLALTAFGSGCFAGYAKKHRWFLVTVNLTWLTCLCTLLSGLVLGYAFLTNDYSLQYVWSFSNRDMDWIYKISAIWGGMDGSMLL
ncbi:MAG: hypothetical protein KDD42_03005, partial [Bdellovibrionales bacterium]|nr:hypothetical protein [Bdellovibrionales bacterium]